MEETAHALASSLELKTDSASAPEARPVLNTSNGPVSPLTISQNNPGMSFFTDVHFAYAVVSGKRSLHLSSQA